MSPLHGAPTRGGLPGAEPPAEASAGPHHLTALWESASTERQAWRFLCRKAYTPAPSSHPASIGLALGEKARVVTSSIPWGRCGYTTTTQKELVIYFQPRKSIAGLHTKLKLLMIFLPWHRSLRSAGVSVACDLSSMLSCVHTTAF